MLVVRKIYEFARETPEAVALIHNLRPLTYAAFGARIATLRASFATLARRPGAVAVVLVDDLGLAWPIDLALRSLGVTTLAVRSAEELANLGGVDIGVVVTVAQEPHAAKAGGLIPNALHLDLTQAELEAGATDDPPPAATSGDHILLTSATTGRYKMILHTAAQEEAGIEAVRPDYEAVMASAGRGRLNLFNFGLWTSVGYGSAPLAWSYGQCLVLHQTPDLWRSLTVPGITHVMATPAMLHAVMADPHGAFPRQGDLLLSIVGGPLSVPLYRQTKARLTEQITTSVGSTEAGTWAVTRVETENDLRWHRLVGGREVEVVDDADQPLPPGKLGQIRVALPKVANQGYLNDAEATAAFFRDRWFYPGDLGVLDGEGRLAMFGRTTDVLNLMGDKIPARPLEEKFEAALELSGVCAFSEPGQGLTEELHIAIETDQPIEEARLAALVHSEVQGFSVVHFHFVARLPRNDMGKIERLKLRRRLQAGR